MRILGTGSALPKYTLTNDKLTEFLDTSDEWIRTRTGIETRQIVTDENLTMLALGAARVALENSKVAAEDIDFLICSVILPDTLTPSLASTIQAAAGMSCPAMDINCACSGFMYSLDVADSLLKSGKAERIMIICAELMSRLLDWTDRSTCVLFGDGAGAVVVDGGENLFTARLSSQGNVEILNSRPEPGNSPFMIDPPPHSGIYMDGQEVYKFAVSHSTHDLKQVVADAGLTLDDIDCFLLHQANKRILEAVRTRLHQPQEKFPSNVEHRGNISSATIPILLDELNRAGRFKPGDILAMSAFGSGLTTGACVIRWTQEPA